MFSRAGCPHCARAKGLLRDAGIEFEALELNSDYTDRTLRAVTAARTFPQIFINGEHIGGADELQALVERAVREMAEESGLTRIAIDKLQHIVCRETIKPRRSAGAFLSVL